MLAYETWFTSALLLDRFPAFNLLQTVGISVSDRGSVRLAGAVESLFGLLLISGAIPQLVVRLAGIPFNATLFHLGTDELLGRLPISGAMLAPLIDGSSPELAPVVDRFLRRSPSVHNLSSPDLDERWSPRCSNGRERRTSS